METGNLWILVITIVVIILPFIMVSRNKRKKKKQILEALKGLASSNHAQIGEYEIFADSAIGMDSAADKLFFLRKKEGREEKQMIEFEDFKSCKLHKKIRNEFIAQILIELRRQKENQEGVYLDFFDVDNDPQLSDQLEIAQRWSEKISVQLKP